MRKISVILAVCLVLGNSAAVTAAESVDYTGKLRVLENLITQCAEKGIPVDYEKVNYTVIERFNSYINTDIKNGVDENIISYNVSCMDELYTEAKSNLEGYLSGDKIPYDIDKNDMLGISNEGSVLMNGSEPIFSIGYGHDNDVMRDVDILPDMGADNIQIEIGPSKFGMGIYGFESSYYADGEIRISSEAAKSGSYGLVMDTYTKKAENVGIWLSQSIECNPGTKYTLSCDVKYASGTGDGYGFWFGFNNSRNFIDETTDAWQHKEITYTTSDTQTELILRIVGQDKNTVYVDNIEIKDEYGAKVNVINSGFETADTSYAYSIGYVFETLKRAQENNVAVSLNLSPHYFPGNLSEKVYDADSPWFIGYNIDEPEAWAVIENYLENLMPLLKGYPALQNICLSNEPDYDTRNFPEFYNPVFREFLSEKHGNIANLNNAYGLILNRYSDFSEISMPSDSKLPTPLGYDWIEFNDKVFTDWHKKMADIVHKHLPEVPVHAKMQNYFYVKDAVTNLARGKDVEMFDTFSDYAGNDAIDYLEDINRYYQTMFLYDYQSSVTDKPVYNSEDHIISDKNPDFSDNQRKHWRNNLWMGAIHGRSMSTIWAWQRTSDVNSPIYFSVSFRPDCAAETGKTSLDLARLSKEVTEIQQNNDDVAIFYSKPSRLYNYTTYCSGLLETYKALTEIGIRPGVVSDKSIDKLQEYKVLVIPKAVNCHPETLSKVTEFIAGGGTVLYQGNVFSKNQYNQRLDNSYIRENGISYSYAEKSEITDTSVICGELSDALKNYIRVTLIDEDTGKAPTDIDFSYSIKNGRLLVNIVNLVYDTTKNISVYLDGKKISGMTDLISGTSGIGTVVAEEYTPQLLSYMIQYPVINNFSVNKDEGIISWEYIPGSYWGADIYKVSETGILEKTDTVETDYYEYPEYGSWFIEAVHGKEKGKFVSVFGSMPFKLNVSKVKSVPDSISAVVSAENISGNYAAAEIEIKAFNSEGKVIGKSVNKLSLKSGKRTDINVSVMTWEKADKIVMSVWDTDKNNLYEERVIFGK